MIPIQKKGKQVPTTSTGVAPKKLMPKNWNI